MFEISSVVVGAIIGVAIALFYRRRRRRPAEEIHPSWSNPVYLPNRRRACRGEPGGID